jgi:hypothetical protein
MEKTYYSVWGTSGTVSWKIKNRRIVVLWDMPYTFKLGRNQLFLKITNEGVLDHTDLWYDSIRLGGDINTPTQQNSSGTFDARIKDVETNCDSFRVLARMGSAHKSVITVNVQRGNGTACHRTASNSVVATMSNVGHPTNSVITGTDGLAPPTRWYSTSDVTANGSL